MQMFSQKASWVFRVKYLIILFLSFILPANAIAQSGQAISLIRDDETERYLYKISTPIFKAAGLNPRSIEIYIVNSPVLNAFVAGGQKMFINTGLIVESDDPSMLIGVIAHETGHIAGGHLIKKANDAAQASIEATIGYILGIASIAAGAPAAGQAILVGGQHLAERGFLKYSRIHEEAADQAALKYLKKVNISPLGLATLLDKLNKEQAVFLDGVSPYVLSHPLSADRVAHIQNSVREDPDFNKPKNEQYNDEHLMIKAKLEAFLDDPKKTLRIYKEEENTLASRYARSIAYYRIPELEKAIEGIDKLIEEFPYDPHFHELKGQMMFENGYVKEAIKSYEKAQEILPTSPLIQLETAVAKIALYQNTNETDQQLIKEAINSLEKVLIKEPRNSFAWRQIAIAYGKNNMLGLSYLALAEEAKLLKQKKDLKKFIRLAKKHLPEDSPASLKIKDLKDSIKDK